MPALSAHYREVGLVTIAILDGRIELGEGRTIFRNTLKELIAKNRLRIILNLSGVNAVDSAGIAELISAYVPLKTGGGVLKLLNPTKKVLAMLEITQLSKVFEVYFDEDAALSSFQ
jgi:anti-sigma B factor antagonist